MKCILELDPDLSLTKSAIIDNCTLSRTIVLMSRLVAKSNYMNLSDLFIYKIKVNTFFLWVGGKPQ